MTYSIVVKFVVSVLCIWSFSGTDAFASPCTDQDNTVKSDGSCWNFLSSDEKYGIVRGIWTGRTITLNAEELSGNLISHFLSLDHAEVPDGTTIGDVIGYFDKLYSYPVNRKILWPNAYLLASLNAWDDDANDRLSLLRFMRDFKKLPTFGTLVEIKDVDQISVKTDFGVFDVKLAGVDGSKLSPEIKSKTLNVLNSLKLATWDDCKKNMRPASVRIQYKDEFFDPKGMLTGYVQYYGTKICLNSGELPTDVLWGNTGEHSLNTLLLQKGLATSIKPEDVSWSKRRKTVRKFNSELNDNVASQKGLYFYGGYKDPSIELISKSFDPPSH